MASIRDQKMQTVRMIFPTNPDMVNYLFDPLALDADFEQSPSLQDTRQNQASFECDHQPFTIPPYATSEGLQPFAQLDGFPPMHAFNPADSTVHHQCHPEQQQQQQQQQQLLSHHLQDLQGQPHTPPQYSIKSQQFNQSQIGMASPLSLSPSSVINTSSWSNNTVNSPRSLKRYKVVRGISSGGTATKPPRIATLPGHHFKPVKLNLKSAYLEDLCLPQWSDEEHRDKRRIIRVERHQVVNRIVAQFSIVGSASENPKTLPSPLGIDVVEVSCLECLTRDDEDEDEDEAEASQYDYKTSSSMGKKRYYITSVEVVKIVELLIGTGVQDSHERRRERGRIRSNLVPFWSRKSISTRLSNQDMRASPTIDGDVDFRVELATRIMSYDVRKPRGFDKEVRILKWERLVPALMRALQSYYAEVPDDFGGVEDEASTAF